MAKVAIKSDKMTFFDGIFVIMENFDNIMADVIDTTLSRRYTLA